MDLLTYWETEPPLRDHLNICLAQTTQAICNSNRGKGPAIKLEKFIIDYRKATLPSRKQVVQKIKHIFGTQKNGRN